MEWFHLVILYGVGILVGFINVMAGGGSTLSLPVLIFMGLDATTANGTNRIAILLQNVSATLSFRRQQVTEFKFGLKMSLFTLPGAIAGAIFAVEINDALFEKILGVVMILVVLTMIFSGGKKQNMQDIAESKFRWLIYPAMIGVGFYGGFIQVGVGYLLMASLFYILRLDLVRVNMYKVLIVLVYTVPAFLIFVVNGKVNWILGLALAAGNATGGWISAHLAVKKGDKLIRIVLIVAIIIMSLKLLNLF